MKQERIRIYNEDCLTASKKIKDKSVDLIICDPPFGIGEAAFDRHYNRDNEKIITGYKEAPDDYYSFTFAWLKEVKRVLKDSGSIFVVMGNSNLRHLLNAAYELGLFEINHIVWKFNFGVYTKSKFVTSHYHVLYYKKSKKDKPTFNRQCRFGDTEKDDNNKSLQYRDLEDVFVINKEFQQGETKNQNKLPTELIDKLILYSSNEGDLVCDFFMGNFTTAYSALSLGRNVCGCEINKNSYDFHIQKLGDTEFGGRLGSLRKPTIKSLPNQGKSWSTEEKERLLLLYTEAIEEGKTKRQAIEELGETFGRGRFSILNVINSFTIGFKK